MPLGDVEEGQALIAAALRALIMLHRFSWFSGMSRLACKLFNILPGFLRLVLGPPSNQSSFLDPLGFPALISSDPFPRLDSSLLCHHFGSHCICPKDLLHHLGLYCAHIW